MENNGEINIKRIIEIFFSKKLIVILIILLSILLGYVYSYYYKKPEYKASSTILLVADENKSEKNLTQTDVNLNNGLISTYSSIIKSNSILQKTINDLNLNMSASDLEKCIEAKQVDNTQFLKISVTNQNPETAKNIANKLVQVFIGQIQEIYNLQNISVVDEAETEKNPCNINHTKDIIMFGFSGIFLSFAVVMTIYMFDDTIKGHKDIEKNVKLRVLGSLSSDKEDTDLIVTNNPKSPIVESIKTIRTNILYSTRKNSILFTSCKQNEGKSWVINNLAATFAQTGKRVILVDANLREENNKSQLFNVEKGEGLSDFIKEISDDQLENLQKTKKYIKETSIPNLYILQNGTIPPNPAELISSNNMRKIIDLLKNMYDIILIDGTSSILVADSIALSSMVDSTILVAENKKTKISDLIKVKKLIQDVNGNILGVILNRADIQGGKYYGKKYGYYYGYDSNQLGEKLEEKSKSISLDEIIDLAKEKIELQSNVNIEDNNEILETETEKNDTQNSDIKLLRQEILGEINKLKNVFVNFKRKDKYDRRINTLNDSINCMNSNMNDNIGNMNNNINTINDNIGNMNNNINTINDNIGNMNDNINTINDDIGNMNNNINTINDDIGNMNNNINTINDNIGNMNNNIDTMNDDINNLKQILEVRENDNELVKKFMEEINELKNEIMELKENQDLNKNELMDRIEKLKDDKMTEQIPTAKSLNNIISFESLRKKKANKKVFNIKEDTITFDDLQRLSSYTVELNDETSLLAMNN